MSVLNQGRHAAEFLLSEANGNFSRESITILSGEGVIKPGQVLGLVPGDTGTVTVGDPVFSGTGNGVLTKANPAHGAGVKEGTYRITCIEPVTNGGVFTVEDPDGVEVGVATVGVAFDGVVKFTIADGATDFAAGAVFTLAVSIADAAGSGKYRSCDPTNTDGSAVGRAVALYGCDATSSDQKISAIVRNAEVNKNLLVWDAEADTDNERNAILANLKSVGIIAR